MQKKKVGAIQSWGLPGNLRELHKRLGFCNLIRRFIVNYSKIVCPVTRLTQKDRPWQWGEEEDNAWNKLKAAICCEPVLWHHDPSKPYFLETDASGVAMGAILSQRQEDGYLHSIVFMSQTFKPAELNHDTYNKEVPTIITAFREWCILEMGPRFYAGFRYPPAGIGP